MIKPHWSALRCWRLLRHSDLLSAGYIESGACSPLGGLALKATPAELQKVRDDYALGEHIHVMVSAKNRRHGRRQVSVHRWDGGANAPCFVELQPGLYASSPALCFVQLCAELDLIGRIRLGFELCSSYAVRENGAINESVPLATLETLARYAQEWPTAGSKRALQALEYVLEGSRSPKETELAMKLGLPCRLGGFGLSGFTMNPKLALGSFGQKITGKSYCIPDLLWPEHKVDVEYNGRGWHSSPEQRESDLCRRQALAAEGYTVLTVDQRAIERPEALRAVADEICLITRGRRLRIRGGQHEPKAGELYAHFLANGAQIGQPRSRDLCDHERGVVFLCG